MELERYVCKCKNTGSPHCINHLCGRCCDGRNCKMHAYNQRCSGCNRKSIVSSCIDEKCYQCCDNIQCDKHFTNCNCGKRANLQCETFSCCGNCCTSSHCEYHFTCGHELTNRDFNNYKMMLYTKKMLPLELINSIVDDYLDNRIRCCECDYKLTDVGNGCEDALICDGCDKWVCDDWVSDCSVKVSITYYIERYCRSCYENLSTSNDSDESYQGNENDEDNEDTYVST